MNLKQLIQHVYNRPDMYLGEQSLKLLEVLIHGSLTRDEDIELWDGFNAFVKKRFKLYRNYKAIGMIAIDKGFGWEARGLREFFWLWHKYLEKEQL